VHALLNAEKVFVLRADGIVGIGLVLERDKFFSLLELFLEGLLSGLLGLGCASGDGCQEVFEGVQAPVDVIEVLLQ
jgi:hypothetical protein